ncbi:hypothetical protein [Thalassobacterium sedimentorum]|uniref:hypothetical protein n=1 Tax=Thalassobacterium sedimentorum TaxID=3041258 RepID=UPI0028123AC1|nr:hypothetical protein [Coraliomargarita sp. SDUM461004]
MKQVGGLTDSFDDVRADFKFHALRGLFEMERPNFAELLQNMENCWGIGSFDTAYDRNDAAAEWLDAVIVRSDDDHSSIDSDSQAIEYLEMVSAFFILNSAVGLRAAF